MTSPARILTRSPKVLSLVASGIAAVAVAGGTAQRAAAQERAVPDRGYFVAAEELYRGEYQQAIRGFQNEVRGGIRTTQARWVDSICYRAMLGEAYYQSGNPRQALAQFDAACELFLSYPRWLQSVEFRQPPRPDANPARRLAPWGRPARQVTYGAFPETMLVSQGEMITEQRLQRGGPLQTLQMWRINVIEVVRTTALAIRRRNEILGPLGQHDRLSKNLVDALARGGNAPRNHWSNAWTELLLGLAQHGVGESQQALTHVSRGVLVDGRYDHPLTGAALLAQAQLAFEAGNPQAAMNLATEASYAAYAYDDYDVVGAAIELGHDAFMAASAEGVYAPLATAGEWAGRENLDHLATSFLVAEAEELATAGQARPATARLGSISSRRRDLLAGRLGPLRRYVTALVAYAENNSQLGAKSINEALAQQRQQSLRNLRIALANERFDGGQISPRIAVELYGTLLRDPTAEDWAFEPLETLTNLVTSQEAALGRWLAAAITRDEFLLAMDVADLTKRRRFWQAQPLGGRLLAIRHLLEAPEHRLPPETRVQRRNLLLRVPEYAELAEEANTLQRELASAPLADQGNRLPQAQQSRLRRLEKNAQSREELIRRLVLRRDATDFNLPPRRTATQVQASLAPGQAVVVFHQSGNSMFAFVLTREGYHHWRIPDAGPLAERTAEMLRAMGHFNQSRTLSGADLDTATWEPVAKQYGDILFAESRLDLANTAELVIVPDGVLWHAPMEALRPTTGGNEEYIVNQTPVRYVPTMSFAVGDDFAPRPTRNTAIAAASGAGSDSFLSQEMVNEVKETTANALVLHSPLPAPSPLMASLVEQLIVLGDVVLDPSDVYSFTPVPLDRSSSQGALSSWLTLPLPGCERLILAGVHTAAETGLKSRSRGRGESTPAAAGNELFHLSCALLSSGAKTALVSRWQTGGKTHRDLLREFTLELPHVPANAAWRRSVALAQRTSVDPAQEPRLKLADEGGESVEAKHPFMWAGYLLVDTGYDPTPPEEDDGVETDEPAPDGQ